MKSKQPKQTKRASSKKRTTKKRRARGATAKGSPRMVKITLKERQCLDLRLAGFPYDQIAETVGYADPSGAWNAVQRALKKTLAEPAEGVLRMEMERLNYLLSKLATDITAGNHAAIDRALKIHERRHKLLGLDAPVKHDLTGALNVDAQVGVQVDYSKLKDLMRDSGFRKLAQRCGDLFNSK